MEDITEESYIQQVNIRVPEYMKTVVNGWFSIIEAQFHLHHITVSTTKFFTVISFLSAKMVAKVPILILITKL